MNISLNRLLKLLCGGYSNEVQAFENPPLYAHILIRYRPIPQLEPGSLLLEQSYAIAPDEPYRMRVVRPSLCSERGLIVSNFSINDNRRFWGAIDNHELRSQIRGEDLTRLKGCNYHVQEEQGVFKGSVEPGCGCIIRRKGQDSYLLSEFMLSEKGMQTIDRGYHLKTHEHLWGSVAGRFQFERYVDWSEDIPETWLEEQSKSNGHKVMEKRPSS